MPQTQIDEFACSDGSSGILHDGRMIYRTECSARAWSSNAPNNMWSRLKLLVGKIMALVMSCFSGSH